MLFSMFYTSAVVQNVEMIQEMPRLWVGIDAQLTKGTRAKATELSALFSHFVMCKS